MSRLGRRAVMRFLATLGMALILSIMAGLALYVAR
jgi:Na+(H+)/acetate symporter ActP